MRRPAQRNSRRAFAKFGGTLVRVDEPELVYLQTRGSAKIIAVAVPDGVGEYPFFGSEISDEQWSRYLREEVDLRYLILFPKYKRWYEFDLSSFLENREAALEHITFDPERHAYLVPEVSFFARSHTSSIDEVYSDQTTQSFAVDGAWNLSDFSNFYGKLSDIYSFFGGLKNWSDENLAIDARRRVRSAFEHPWRGGFSYVAFFDDLFASQPISDRLGVHSIQYASPGHVDVDGREDVFSDLRDALQEYGKNSIENKKLYNDIYKNLSQGGFLRLDGRNFLNDSPEADLFMEFAASLSNCIKFSELESLYILCENNALVTLKIILAINRRVDALFSFFAEGRAKIPEQEVVLAVAQAT